MHFSDGEGNLFGMGMTNGMHDWERAEAYLKRDRLMHIDMLEAMRRTGCRCLAVTERAVLLENEHGIRLLACDGITDGIQALTGVSQGNRPIVVHSDAARDAVQTVWPALHCGDACYQAAYTGEPVTVLDTCRIEPFPMERADFVMEHYRMAGSLEAVQATIARGDLFAAYVEEELVGFIGYHDDTSIGMLEVLPEARRHRVGFALEQHVINVAISRGRVPYCQVYTWNEASLRLQAKLGMEISENVLYWMFLPNRA